jgi:hypothetical protein
METRFGVNGTICDGVFFTENALAGVTLIRHLHVEIPRQNADLSEVKQRLAREAQALGATVLMNFRYGQKKHQWWESVFSFKLDTESWHGEGDAVTPY